jgi:hypothetical protein
MVLFDNVVEVLDVPELNLSTPERKCIGAPE